MKVLAFNGSPRANGNTHQLLETVLAELRAAGIETEEINVALRPVRGCVACGKCAEKQDGYCALKNDALNGWLDLMRAADGILLGSPVYIAGLSGQLKCFIDRAGMVAAVNHRMFKRKVGASVAAVRRAGALPAFHSMNSFFMMQQMMVVGSSYWNMGFGMAEGEVAQDAEGLQTMRNLGKDMAWLMRSIDKAKLPAPDTTLEERTNFIR